jgi:hypothetical protein
MTIYDELLLGSTHRFNVTFKDLATGNPVEMSNVTVQFFRGGTAVEDSDTPTNNGTGVYYYDKYFSDSTYNEDKYECRFEGESTVGSIQKRAVRFFVLVAEP